MSWNFVVLENNKSTLQTVYVYVSMSLRLSDLCLTSRPTKGKWFAFSLDN